MSREPLLHIVLYQPEIPPNTGNIGRTCVAVGAKLWLVRPLGFSLDESQLRRAGLDYWPFLDYEVVDNWSDILQRLPGRTVWCIENPAAKTVWQASFSPGDILLFGRGNKRASPQSGRSIPQSHPAVSDVSRSEKSEPRQHRLRGRV